LGALFWGLGLGFRSGTIYEVRYLLHNSEQITPKKCGLFLKYALQLEAESRAYFRNTLRLLRPLLAPAKHLFFFPPLYIPNEYHKENKQGCVVTLWPCHLHLIKSKGKRRVMEIQIFHHAKL